MIKRSFRLAGHATSVALEPEFWTALEARATAEGTTVPRLMEQLDAGRGDRSLASACRVAALGWATEPQSASGSD